jgi:hypothetical protein
MTPAFAADLKTLIPTIKRSVVGVGTFEPTRSPATVFVGTGFVVGDGLSIITNAHVVPDVIGDGSKVEQLGIVTMEGSAIRFRPAKLVARDANMTWRIYAFPARRYRRSNWAIRTVYRKGRNWLSPAIRLAWCWAACRHQSRDAGGDHADRDALDWLAQPRCSPDRGPAALARSIFSSSTVRLIQATVAVRSMIRPAAASGASSMQCSSRA